MNWRIRNAMLILVLLGSSLFILPQNIQPASAAPAGAPALDVNVPEANIPEADDFATTNFGNAWDMSEFSDISQYLNGAGRYPSMKDVQVKDSIFSATSIVDNTSWMANFSPLFSGYTGFMQIGGNLGTVHSINPNKYSCLYLAMKVDSPQFGSNSGKLSDQFLIAWESDSPDSKAPVAKGVAFDRLYPETAVYPFTTPVVHNWRLYKFDLKNPPHGLYSGSTPWNKYSAWKGLRITPTIYKDVNFQIDWVRLTSCDSKPEQQAKITWSPDAKITTIWARPSGTNRTIAVAFGIDGNSGSYSLDTAGIEPGSYDIGLGTLNDCCAQWSKGALRINTAPVISFIKPAPDSGEDYAASTGNAWDMDPSDITQIRCSNYGFEDGILKLDTVNPAALPGNCKGSGVGEADPQIFLNLPGPLIVAGQYRYLTFRHYISGDYPTPADGMIGRWIWTTTNNCTRVSADIPYDVGWHTYSIDLYDAFNGNPVGAGPSGCELKPWKDTGQIIRLRFDPNENWTGNQVPATTFHEEFDWIRLTKEDRVAQGSPYSVQINSNLPMDKIKEINYFYTTDRQNPTQQQALSYNQPMAPVSAGSHKVFLATITRGTGSSASAQVASDATFAWDTSAVNPGDYYICAQANDGYNRTTFCSEAPVQVYTP